jgi:hypothetical protein
MEPRKFLRRKAASKYLHDVHGIVRAPSTLAKYAVVGGGPVFQRIGRDPVYTTLGLDEWVASMLSGPMRSTSEAARPGASEDGQQVGPPIANGAIVGGKRLRTEPLDVDSHKRDKGSGGLCFPTTVERRELAIPASRRTGA